MDRKVTVRVGGSAPGNLPEHDLDELEAAYGLGQQSRTMAQVSRTVWDKLRGGEGKVLVEDDGSDLVPPITTADDKWKRFHGRFAGRAK